MSVFGGSGGDGLDRASEAARMLKRFSELPCDRGREQWGYCVPDLFRDLRPLLIGGEDEVVVEAHQACGLPNRDRPVCRRVEVAALLGLVELGADREGGPVPPEAAEDVGGAGRFVPPAGRDEM